MKKYITIISIIMAVMMLWSTVAFAGVDDTCIAMGADLDDSGMDTVLNIFGIDYLDDYNVIEITNKDEHKYLEGYVDEDQIGTQALSCVMITETDDEDIDVETHNINYCTEDMYENALETAGIHGAKVIVAAPYSISGTAALVGTIKAYEEMSGHKVHDDVVEAAVEELTTTGDLGDEIGDKETATDIIGDLKDMLADNPDMSDADIIQAIKDLADKYGVLLSDKQIEKIKKMITGFKGIDIDWGGLKDKAQDLVNQAEKSGFFDKLITWFKSLFK